MTSGQADRIAASRRVANVGCYATASIALLRPLVEAGVLPSSHPISINAISGYSGGGKKLIESFENPDAPDYDERPFWLYGLRLSRKPKPQDLQAVLQAHYAGQRFVTVAEFAKSEAVDKLDPEALNGTNDMRLHVFGNADNGQAVLVGLLDNLGKGASGAAVQNLNLMLGLDEGIGLDSKRAA